MKKIILIIAITCLMSMFLFGEKSNQLTLSGSTTVLPIAQAGAEAYMSKNPDVNISVRGGGSGVGVAALMSGTVDIANSSRQLKAKEMTQAKSKGVNPTGYAVANDGITVIVSKSNPVKDLSIKQLKGIYTGAIKNWYEVGGPNMPIVIISRDVASGTFEVFNEKVLSGAKVIDTAQMLASNNAIASTVGDTPGAIGYVGLGYVTEKNKIVSIENVIPSEKTVKSAEYKLSRKLYMFTNGKAKGNAANFISWLQSAEGQAIVVKQGFISLN